MTADKNSDTEPDVIEGVAVEKPAKKRRRSAAGAGGGMSESGSGRTREAPSGTGSRGDADIPHTSNISGRSVGKKGAAVILAIIAMAIALAGMIFQQWTASRQEARLRAETGSAFTLCVRIRIVPARHRRAYAKAFSTA